MEETKPFNAIHSIGLFKKILVYFNVTAFKVANAIPSASNFRNNYNSRGFSVAMIVVSEYATAKLFFWHMASVYQLRILFFGLFIHTVIDILFIKDIVIMAGNYYTYYNKVLYYLYLIFLAVGFFIGLIILNNQIGHVK